MLTIKQRLIILVALMSAILIGVGTYGWMSLRHAVDGQEKIYHGGIDAISELHLMTTKLDNILGAAIGVLSGSMNDESAIKTIKTAEETFNKTLEAYRKIEGNQYEKLAPKIQVFQSSLAKLNAILSAKDRPKLEQFLKEDISSAFNPLNDAINTSVQFHIEDAKKEYLDEIESASFAVKVFLISMILGTLLGATFAAFTIKNISDSLQYTIKAVNRLAEGDTSIVLEAKSQDEIEKLLLAMQNMIGTTNTIINALKQVASGDLTPNVSPRSTKDTLGIAVQEMIERLRGMISKIQSEIKTVVGSSHEIFTSVTQVSSNTAETAAAVTETTTTTEELKQTAHVASEKAQGVLESAEETLKIVKSSEQSLGNTITDMNQIQEKMRTISESIIKLSENSQAIGEIIDTVNDLAEQSNLLAVNAAIEAARAGEQGKSFGVVAQEIRNLAEQSKSATIQVKSILNDIQNATSAAVMATEQGSKAVAKGVDQSSETSQAIKNLFASIANVAQSAKQIALSSQQQLIGIDQVTVAMSNINEASNQHVEHMKQIETSVVALNSVGGTLKEIADRYKMVR